MRSTTAMASALPGPPPNALSAFLNVRCRFFDWNTTIDSCEPAVFVTLNSVTPGRNLVSLSLVLLSVLWSLTTFGPGDLPLPATARSLAAALDTPSAAVAATKATTLNSAGAFRWRCTDELLLCSVAGKRAPQSPAGCKSALRPLDRAGHYLLRLTR